MTEESLATFFADCGTVMDCRICGDPNSAMRFAFIEFMEESGAQEVGVGGEVRGRDGFGCVVRWLKARGPGGSGGHRRWVHGEGGK